MGVESTRQKEQKSRRRTDVERLLPISRHNDRIIELKQELFVEEEEVKRQELLSMHKQEKWIGKDGDWYTHIYDEHGKRKIRHRKTEKELDDFLVEFYRTQQVKTNLRDVFNLWIDEKLEYGEIQKQSYDRYRTDFDRFFPDDSSLCKKEFRDITGKDLEKHIKSTIHKMKLTRKVYNGMATLLNGIFKYGKHEELTTFSIVVFMKELELSDKIFQQRFVKKEEQVFSEDETQIIMEYFETHKTIWDLALKLIFYTGMRVGEITALKHCDIKEDVIQIRRHEAKIKDDSGHTTVVIKDFAKTEAGCRDIIIPAEAKEVIDEILELNPNGEYLIENSHGTRIRGTTLTKHSDVLCKKLGLNHHSAHKIRKTYGTILLDGGVADSIVADQMGHKSVDMTRALYYFCNKNHKVRKEQIGKAVHYQGTTLGTTGEPLLASG